MKNFIKMSFLFLAFATMTINAQAQKYGYINSDEILASMNEVKQMQPELESLQTQLQKKGQGMVESLKAKSAKAQQQLERGEMSPKEQETMQAELQAEQGKIMAFEQEMQETIMKKRQTLLEPILERVNNAINEVAKAQGYTMVFNGSPAVGVLLYVDESSNITPAVKAKLGL